MHCYLGPLQVPLILPQRPRRLMTSVGSLALSSSARFSNDGHQEFRTKQEEAIQPPGCSMHGVGWQPPSTEGPLCSAVKGGELFPLFLSPGYSLSLTGSSDPTTTFVNSAFIKSSSNYPFKEYHLYLASILTSRSV